MSGASASVVVVGDDALAASLGALIDGGAKALDRLPAATTEPTVVVRREGGPPHDMRLHESASQGDARLLPVRCEYDGVVIGPWIGQSAWPCLRCLSTRRRRALADSVERRLIQHRLTEGEPLPLLTAQSLRDVIAAVIMRFLERGDEDGPGRSSITRVDATTLAPTVHRYLRDPLCSHCASTEPDRAADAEVTLRPRLKQDPEGWRQQHIADRAEEFDERFVDPQCGMVRALIQDTSASLPSVSAPMGVGDRGRTELSGGQQLTYEASRLSGIAEALERYAGVAPRGRRPQVRGSYAELQDVAIDPTALGLHEPSAYEEPGSPFRPYTPEAECEWVWGHSFRRDEPVLVPLEYVYYGQRREGLPTRDKRFVYEISNGCALGGSVEEALLYGLFEVAERDAFLLTWYAQLSVPEIDLRGHSDRTVRILTERMEREEGIRIRAFDIGLDLLPAVWVMAIDEADRPSYPKAVCAAAAHLDPARALGSALLELATVRNTARHEYSADPDAAERMVADSTLVRRMSDHLVCYSHPAAFPRFDFLTQPSQRHQPVGRPEPPSPAPDVTEDLRWTLDVFQAAGVEVVVVDQTTDELRDAGLTAVKAIGVGALPMTFGHHLRRVQGLPRLLEVPAALGFRSEPLAEDDINPLPHPFP